MTRSAAELVELASVEPRVAIEEGHRLLTTALPVVDQVLAWRAIGMASRVIGRGEDSAAALQTAVDIARQSGLRDHLETNSISLAMSLGSVGRHADAFAVLDSLDPGPGTIGRVHFQRATLLLMAGDLARAIAEFDVAIPHLERNEDLHALGLTHKNLCLAMNWGGEPRLAADHGERGVEIFTRLGNPLEVAAVGHNVGMALAAAGELVEALGWFNRSLPALEEIAGPSFEPGRCHTLLAAGLFEEAHTEAERLARRLEEIGMTGEIPEAWLLAAEASLLLDHRDRAGDEARRAAADFEAQGRMAWTATARLVELQASDAAHAAMLMSTLLPALDSAGMTPAAVKARAAGARRLVRNGELELATTLLAEARRLAGHAPLALEIDLRLAATELHRATGDHSAAARVAAGGMRILDRSQRAVAATDVRAGLARHASQLAGEGLALAIESRSPRRVWAWMERTRATALAYRPVTEPRDDEVALLLPKLRALTAEAMRPEATAQTRWELLRVESRVADLTRTTAAGAVRDSAAGLPDQVIEALGETCLIELAVVESQMWAVVVHGRRVRLVDCGPAAPWTAESRLVSSAMRHALSSPGHGDARLRRRLEVLRAMVGRLVPATASRLVMVAPPELAAVPWPSLCPIPVTVAASAATWVRAAQQPPTGQGTVAISGPDLDHARSEVDAVAGLYGETTGVQQGNTAAVLDAASTAHTLHLACHGRLRNDQPLFNSLRFADGELYLHELQQLERLAPVMVLSSCESGSVGGSGSEMLGMASVLMAAGVRTIIASPWPIPDTPATVDAMVDLHRRIAAGADPALAIREGAQTLPGAAYLCFGA
ncbi:MAG: CHAT domain-containing protein [Acidimicrobiia bacterium]|nr:CHAT domain-containing protein [Acidimicrobiia bacterium]